VAQEERRKSARETHVEQIAQVDNGEARGSSLEVPGGSGWIIPLILWSV
jgi:hypothetical protein